MGWRLTVLGAKAPSNHWPQLLALLLGAVLLGVIFQSTFVYLYYNWHREEYSHGFLIPPISAYLLWQRRAALRSLPFRGSWLGFAIVLLGLALFLLNCFFTVMGADAYALVIVIVGLALAMLGWQAFKVVAVPLGLLFLMNPLPTFWYNNLSDQLQLLSSELGAGLIRLCGISVLLEGNVIDLGTYKLQVAEACSGLRYLFPLMTLGAVVAYLFEARAWARWLLFLSTIPVTVLMNSLRIGVIGILVDRFGIEQAEGFLHQFEGWLIFMACFAVLLLLAKLLLRVSGDRRSLRQAMGLQPATAGSRASPPALGPTQANARLGAPALASAAVLMLAIYPAIALPRHAETIPARADFRLFPQHLGAWHGHRDSLEPVYLDILKLDDYVLADFLPDTDGRKAERVAGVQSAAPVNLYVAYYASQRTGRSVHSPASCLPGGGWRMEQFAQRVLPSVRSGSGFLKVNRAVVSQGSERELVYYWFQERGRDLTSEYLVKWYLFTDALARNRTDGALVRFVTPVRTGESLADADARLERFGATVVPALHPYLPD